MNNENFHTINKVPPLAHALHKWNDKTKTLTYEYNGEDIISISFPESDDVGFRHGSDGTIQSIQYMQQIYIAVEKPMFVDVKFKLSDDTINMRPHRAKSEQAILGQIGNTLIDGVNGLYDITQDLLIDFNGCEWAWSSKNIVKENNKSIITAKIKLSLKPLFINLRMHYYQKHLGYKYHEPWNKKPNNKAVAGWCSWEAFRRDIDINKINQIVDFMEAKLKDYGLEYIQIDDGYQKMPLPFNPKGTMAEGWMTCDDERFPQGHKQIVKTISNKGFSPAIWTNANITNKEFPLYNGDALIYSDNEPLKGEWIDFLYNCTSETLEKHVTPTFKNFSDAGYKYVKIDAIRHLLFDGLHEAVRLGIMSNEDAEKRFRNYIAATKNGLSDDIYYLASWGEMHEVIGLVDACRISMDANPTWAGIRMQLFETARWFHSQRILFLNDPDHVCVRTKTDWAKSVLSLISLSGGLYMLSDTVDTYTDEKLDIIRKTLPTLQTRPAETGPLNLDFPAYTWTKLHGFAVQSHETPVEMEDVLLDDAYNMAGNYPTMDDNHPFSTLWAFHINSKNDNWCVMARFATVPLRSTAISLSAINLAADKEYHAFDFWKQTYLGIVKDSINCDDLSIGQCQIVALREIKNEPQFIASSRHVSMDAISIQEQIFNNNTMTLIINGVVNTTESYYVYIPQGYSIKNIKYENAEINYSKNENLLTLNISFTEAYTKLDILLDKER